ncbi:uncharacterized protein [Nothobranchius furzeri]|uniref:Transcript variant X3 n=3 Tax=Nothobranchius TaxID=28779 RepID=A0A9D2YR39_NOTFU|nr:uncharacterized protein LOC107388413 isoform X2 [Nothobranchius furzeri]KAF7224014.1 transcript variant X3 [Nothobranchius furzeri]
MADLTHRCHGNFPQRRAIPFPQGLRCRARLAQEATSSETGPNLSPENEPNWCCNGKPGAAFPPSGKREQQPGKSVQDLLKRTRIHPEAQRILGNSSIAVVSLERLNFQTVSLLSLQPVVSLVRLPSQTQTEHQHDQDLKHHQQNGFRPKDILELKEVSLDAESAEAADWDQTGATSWTELYHSESASFGEPEQDSGFDCESNPDQSYILFASGSEDGKSDSETFYLDPDAEQAVLFELDPEVEAEQGHLLGLEDESEVVEVDHGEDQSLELECEARAEPEQSESEDFCAVCLNGGDLLCCDRCPKVYHLSCHVPRLTSFPLGDWVCTLCRSDQEPPQAYDCENTHPGGTVKVPYTLSHQDQRRCEKLSLLLYCHTLSAPFHEPVSPLARNYYQIIKKPIDLSVIRRKLDRSNTLHYFSSEQFVDDVLLMFKNCAKFNYPDSEVAHAGRNLEMFFLSKLKEIFPDQTFPSATQNRTDRARLQWFRRKRRNVFSGKKYYL